MIPRRVYIVYGHKDHRRNELTKALRAAGHHAFDPLQLPTEEGKDWGQFEHTTTFAIKDCDVAILLTPFILQGAVEIGYAFGRGKETILLTSPSALDSNMSRVIGFYAWNIEDVIKRVNQIASEDR